MLTIGALSRRAGVSRDTIRFYERIGLISPVSTTDAGYRLYSHDVVRWIAFVKNAQLCGFSLEDLTRLGQLRSGAASNGELRSFVAQKQMQVQRTLEAAQTVSDALKSLLDVSRDAPLIEETRRQSGASEARARQAHGRE